MPRLWPHGMDRMTADKVRGQDALKFACLYMSMHHPTGKPGESKTRDRRIRNGLKVIHLEAGVNGYLRRRFIRFQPPRGVEPRPPVNDPHVLGEVVDAQWAATPAQMAIRCLPSGRATRFGLSGRSPTRTARSKPSFTKSTTLSLKEISISSWWCLSAMSQSTGATQ